MLKGLVFIVQISSLAVYSSDHYNLAPTSVNGTKTAFAVVPNDLHVATFKGHVPDLIVMTSERFSVSHPIFLKHSLPLTSLSPTSLVIPPLSVSSYLTPTFSPQCHPYTRHQSPAPYM